MRKHPHPSHPKTIEALRGIPRCGASDMMERAFTPRSYTFILFSSYTGEMEGRSA
jgi:hypothetical protein